MNSIQLSWVNDFVFKTRCQAAAYRCNLVLRSRYLPLAVYFKWALTSALSPMLEEKLDIISAIGKACPGSAA